MEENLTYSIDEIKRFGLNEKQILRDNAKVYMKDDKVYFFEEIDSNHMRLYTIINKKSFFL
jgi:hypothetical protein